MSLISSEEISGVIIEIEISDDDEIGIDDVVERLIDLSNGIAEKAQQ